VSQASFPGPLLFVIYINDLPDRIFNVFEMYADDSKEIAELNKGFDSILQEDINEIKEWCTKANRALGRMRKTFKYFNIQLFKVFHPAFLRTHLEFASAVMNSMSRREINRFEGIQKRATKMVIELRGWY